MQIDAKKLKKINLDILGFFLHKSSVLFISLIIFFKSSKLQIDTCFLTKGFSFQKIAGLEVLIRLSRLFNLFICSLILCKRCILLLKILNYNT